MYTNGEIQLDALLPPDMAAKAEAIGVRKANMNWLRNCQKITWLF